MVKIILSLFLVAILSGTLTVLSYNTHQGDLLYPFKLYIVTPIEQAMYSQLEKYQ